MTFKVSGNQYGRSHPSDSWAFCLCSFWYRLQVTTRPISVEIRGGRTSAFPEILAYRKMFFDRKLSSKIHNFGLKIFNFWRIQRQI